MLRSCRKLVFIGLTAAILALIGCGGTAGKPTFLPLPTPTTPPDFVTYTDESSSFRIQYPPDWDLALSEMTAIEGELSEFVEGKTDVTLEDTRVVFFAGDTTRGFYVNILVESLRSKMTVDEYFEVTASFLHELVPSWKTNAQSRVVVGEREAIIEDLEYDLSDLGQGDIGTRQVIQLITVEGKVAWSVSCVFPAEASQPK